VGRLSEIGRGKKVRDCEMTTKVGGIASLLVMKIQKMVVMRREKEGEGLKKKRVVDLVNGRLVQRKVAKMRLAGRRKEAKRKKMEERKEWQKKRNWKREEKGSGSGRKRQSERESGRIGQKERDIPIDRVWGWRRRKELLDQVSDGGFRGLQGS